jgi:hypothetical protein
MLAGKTLPDPVRFLFVKLCVSEIVATGTAPVPTTTEPAATGPDTEAEGADTALENVPVVALIDPSAEITSDCVSFWIVAGGFCGKVFKEGGFVPEKTRLSPIVTDLTSIAGRVCCQKDNTVGVAAAEVLK